MTQELLSSYEKSIVGLTKKGRSVIEVLFGIHNNCNSIFPSQDYISRESGVCTRTVQRSLYAIEKSGLITSSQRWNNSNVYTISPDAYKPEVQSLLKKFFNTIPIVKASIMLPLALGLQGEMSYYPERYRDTVLRKDLFSSLSLSIFNINGVDNTVRAEAREGNAAVSLFKKTRRDMSNEVSSLTGTVVNICRALRRRGCEVTNDDAYCLYAYSEEVLHHASAVMKNATPKKPIAFLLSECKKYAAYIKQEPNRQLVEYCRSNKLVILKESFFAEKFTVAPSVSRGAPKQEQVVLSTAERYRLDQQKAQEKSATAKAPLTQDEEKAGWERVIADYMAKGDLNFFEEKLLERARSELAYINGDPIVVATPKLPEPTRDKVSQDKLWEGRFGAAKDTSSVPVMGSFVEEAIKPVELEEKVESFKKWATSVPAEDPGYNWDVEETDQEPYDQVEMWGLNDRDGP